DHRLGAHARAPVDDPFSDALQFLAAHHGRAISREALLAGLPITDGRLSVSLFIRAAQRAGLEAEPVRRSLDDIAALVLPVILAMHDGSTRILLAIDHANKTATLIDPSAQTRPTSRSFAAIARDYTGYAFLIRPTVAADARTTAAGDL